MEVNKMADNSRAINRVFTRGVLNDLLINGSNEVFDYVVRRYVNDPGNKTHGELYSEIYAHLGQEKRNEYYYMNTLLNKLLVGIHSVNTTTALTQVKVGKHIADFVMINGEGVVYEIKSDLDNFNRLREQISDYYRAFSKVSVLASKHELGNVEQMLVGLDDIGASVGIYVMSEKDRIFSSICGRKPMQFDEHLEHGCLFQLMRKREYESLLRAYFHGVPQVAPVFHYRACLECFQKIPIITAQQMCFDELRKRNKITKAVFENVQSELKSVVYFAGLSRKIPDIEQLLQTTYRG